MILKRIAIVERDYDTRLLIEASLVASYELVEFDSALEALAALPIRPPDLVLIDMVLPGMDGIQVLRQMREDPRLANVPAIALTSHKQPGERDRALACGFDRCLMKPIDDFDLLLAMVGELLDGPARRSA